VSVTPGARLSGVVSVVADRKDSFLGPSGSLISTTGVDRMFAEQADAELGNSRSLSVSADLMLTGTGEVTIPEIKDHVWSYSHEAKPKSDVQARLREIDGTIEREGQRRTMPVAAGGRRRKVSRIIQECSAVHNESGAGRNTRRGATDYARKSGELEQCYSAMRFRKYLDKRKMKAPDFIDHCDFRVLQAERQAEKERIRAIGWSGMVLTARQRLK
jgi:hypothetical protein